jgi:hypothetical protein
MKGKIVVLVAVVAVGLGIAASASASAGYVDELTLGNAIEAKGVTWAGRHHAVDNAFCSGLRRFGVRTSEWSMDKFTRFKCSLSGADGHFYTAQVAVSKSGNRLSYRPVSFRRDF